MPEANHFPKVYYVAPIQWFQFMVHVICFLRWIDLLR